MSPASRNERVRIGLFLALTLAVAGTAGASGPAATFVLDDFEATRAPARRFGELLETTLGPPSGTVRWRRLACDREGADGHCLRVEYAFPEDPRHELGFGIDLGDVDATRYDHVAFWLRGDRSTGFNPTLRIGFRRPRPGVSGLLETGTDLVRDISGEWRRFVIPLNRLSGIRDWTHVRAFFVSLAPRQADVKRGAYELDEVMLVKTGHPGPSISDPVVPRKKNAWVRSVGGPKAAQPLIQATLRDWPRRLLVDRRSLPASDREFLARVARDTWRGLDSLTNRENGLPVDHVELSKAALAPPGARVGDYTNVTNVALHLVSVVAAREFDFISRAQAIERIERALETLARLETHRGFFFNYYDTTTLERTSNFISFVDSSWLTAALMVVRTAFPEVRERATRLIDAGDYSFFYDDVWQRMSHGYYVNVPVRSEYHYGLVFTEARLGSLIAIGKGDAPEEHWFRLDRTLRPEAVWQRQRPRGRVDKTVRGHRVTGGFYEWRELRYVPSWGGSMFEALMPTLLLDEKRYAAKSLGRNDEVHAAIQRLYGLEELRYPVWGFSPTAIPGRNGYGEYGVEPLGTLGYPAVVVAPYASALALETMPEPAIANLRRLVELYDSYGEYGFYDAVEPTSGRVAYQYLALDQAMILVATANFLKDRCIQRLFASDAIAARALPVLADEDFLDGAAASD